MISKVEIEKYLHEGIEKLTSFANKCSLHLDWHEPDNQGVSGTVEGKKLDNAFGNSGECQEMIVVLKQEGTGEELRINLATLLACATKESRK